MNENLNETLQPEINRLHQDNLSLIMATKDHDGFPNASYAPFVYVDGHYYVFISEIAPHTQHLLNTPELSIMIIDDERNTRNIYARARLSYQAKANQVQRDCDEFKKAMDALYPRGGNTLDVLTQLGDFSLFRLTPQKGRLVLGFGKAYTLNAENQQAQWLTDGHVSMKSA
ncbi:pyridoxamine 5'-phosphate oxidase family protein [Neisseria sp. Ec49-e6-T10]|uniref:pyridoxamine 5'-phosphate oxidase family protein n=1 Tax=Neisseria sp. Ec49-e6-T10 TaxID=3140744 RepID=UPI003EC0DD5F